MEHIHAELIRLLEELRSKKKQEFDRKVPIGDLLTERSDNAQKLGFGEGTTCYDNVHVTGDVKVGKHTYIGPNVILDGTGGLEIGDYCSISAGVHIYTHNSVLWALNMGKAEYERMPVKIGSGVYIGPGTIVTMGVSIGNQCLIGAQSLVNRSIPERSKAWGTPARVMGTVDEYLMDKVEPAGG